MAQCAPSRSALLTGRHPLRSGTQTVPTTGGPDGLTRWEVTIAQALSDVGYATGMWGKWQLGSDPEQRSPALHQNTAIGFSGDPVPPMIRNGAVMNRNSHRPALSHVTRRSSNWR